MLGTVMGGDAVLDAGGLPLTLGRFASGAAAAAVLGTLGTGCMVGGGAGTGDAEGVGALGRLAVVVSISRCNPKSLS